MTNDMFNIVLSAAVRDNLAGISRDHRIVRDIEVHVRTRCNHHVVPNLDPSDDNCVGADPDTVPDHRHALSASAIALPDYHSRRQVDVASQPALRMDGQMPKVADVESRADLGFDWNIKAISIAVVIEQEAMEESACNAQQARPVACRLAFAQEVTEAEARNCAKRVPERRSIVAPTIAPKVCVNRGFEVYWQCNSLSPIVEGIVSRSGARLEAQNEIAENILPSADALLGTILAPAGGLARP